MNIIEQSHTKNMLNSSILITFVLKIDHMLFNSSEDDYGLLRLEITKLLEDLKIRVNLIKLESYSSPIVDLNKTLLILFCQERLKSDEYFVFNAK